MQDSRPQKTGFLPLRVKSGRLSEPKIASGLSQEADLPESVPGFAPLNGDGPDSFPFCKG